MDDRRAGSASYQDPLISIQDGTLTITRYYFPTQAKPVVTPDDPDAFRAALTMAGVPISTAARRGAGQRS